MRFAGNPSLKILRAMDLLCPDFYEYNIRKEKRKLSTAAAKVEKLPGLILVNFITVVDNEIINRYIHHSLEIAFWSREKPE
jgi:hypothetical protein